jgi:hypothetical protein
MGQSLQSSQASGAMVWWLISSTARHSAE